MKTDEETVYPRLKMFFGLNYYPDWASHYSSADEAVEAYARNAVPQLRRETVDELTCILKSHGNDEDALGDVVYEDLLCGYYPPGDGLTLKQWLQHLVDRFTPEVER